MSESTSERSPRERQLDALIAEYYGSVEQGQPVNQESFLQKHPDFAAELRDFFADVGQIERAVPAARPELEETQPPDGALDSRRNPGTKVQYLGDYEILEELGAGGMGVVYKARQTKLKKIVALKMIKVGQFASDEEVRRFQAEARAAAKLDHPGIVAVHEVGVDHRQHYYAMDFVGGGSLSMLHREAPVAARQAGELVQKLAEAMHYAHGQGIVHRDLKPANVLLATNGAPRITDFGLAKRLWSDDDSAGLTMTETGQVLGTAGYMSPEQAAGKTRLVGPLSDIYSLGAILYALLTSRAPFVGASQADTILQVIQKEPISPRTLNPSVPRDLETICLKCLEKEPHKRYGTAQLLADDLSRFLEGRPVLARPISSPARAWRWCRRNPWIASLSAAVAMSLLVGTMVASSLAYVAFKNAAEAERRGIALGREIGQREEAQHVTYHARLSRMQGALARNEWSTLERLLAESVPAEGERDLRGWEWYYLRAQFEHRAWRMPHNNGASTSFDWDQQTGRLAVLYSGRVEVWLPLERRLLYAVTLAGVNPSDDIDQVRWCPDHRQLAITIDRVRVQVLNPETKATVCTISVPDLSTDGGIRRLDWSPSGDRIAITATQGTASSITLWKVAPTPLLVATLKKGDPYSIHWGIDEYRCITTSRDGSSTFWDIGTWTPGTMVKHRGIERGDIAWSPDRTRAVYCLVNSIAVANSDQILAGIALGPSTQIPTGISPSTARWLDHDHVIVAFFESDAPLLCVNVNTRRNIERHFMHSGRITKLAIGPEGLVASAAAGEAPLVWDFRGSPINSILSLNSGSSTSPQWHPRDTALAYVKTLASSSGLYVPAVWSPGTSQEHLITDAINPKRVCWTQGGESLAIEAWDGTWQTVPWPITGRDAPTPSLRGWGPEYSWDGAFRAKTRILNGDPPFRLLTVSAQPDKVSLQLDTVHAYAWHPSKSRIALAKSTSVELYDLLDGEWRVVTTFRSPNRGIGLYLVWSDNGDRLLASGSRQVSGTVPTFWVLDGNTLEMKHVCEVQGEPPTSFTWSPDGSRIFSADEKGTLRCWDSVRGTELMSHLLGEGSAAMCISANGRWLAKVSETGLRLSVLTSSPPTSTKRASPTYVKLDGYEDVLRPIADLDAAVSDNPQRASAYLDRANWYLVRQKWTEALNSLNEYLKLQPTDNYWRGHALTLCVWVDEYKNRSIRQQHSDWLLQELRKPTTKLAEQKSILCALVLDRRALEKPEAVATILGTLQRLEADAGSLTDDSMDWYRAAVLYRAGRNSDAIAAVTTVGAPVGGRARTNYLLSHIFRSMALVKSDVKRAAAELAAEPMQLMPYEEGSAHWFATDWLRFRIADSEARSLLQTEGRISLPDYDPIPPLQIPSESLDPLSAWVKATNSHEARLRRARWHHDWHRWGEAADDYARVVGDEGFGVCNLAATSLAAGREGTYRRCCKDLQTPIEGTSDVGWIDAFSLMRARVLALRPGMMENGEELARAAAESGKRVTGWHGVTSQIPLLYRLKRYEEALSLVPRAAALIECSHTQKVADDAARASLHLWEAMSLWELGRQPEAREALGKAKGFMKQVHATRGRGWGSALEVAEAIIVLPEAEALIGQ